MISDTALVLICVTALAPLIGVAAADSIREVFPLRRDLLGRLALARLAHRLRRQGIGVQAYLRQVSRREMAAQILVCETCSSKSRCDAALRAPGEPEFAFCPANRERGG